MFFQLLGKSTLNSKMLTTKNPYRVFIAMPNFLLERFISKMTPSIDNLTYFETMCQITYLLITKSDLERSVN